MVGIKRLIMKSSYAYEMRHGIRQCSTLWMKNRADILNLIRPGGIGIELGVAEAELSSQLLARGILKKLYGSTNITAIAGTTPNNTTGRSPAPRSLGVLIRS